MEKLSHINKNGSVQMVDISDKSKTMRTAVAQGSIFLKKETLNQIWYDKISKGNVLTTAKIAGIQAAKKTAQLIPLCHAIDLSWVDIQIKQKENGLTIESKAKASYTTGVEMEALTAVSVTLLTIYDMCKAADQNMIIDNIKLIEKIKDEIS